MATAVVPYASFVSGKPIMVPYAEGSAVTAGDVVVTGDLPAVAHESIPAFAGGLTTDALAIMGGVYRIMADGAISPGSDVWWDATNKKVTLTSSGNKHFGKLVGGPTGGLDGVGPAADGDLALVYHCPMILSSGASISSPLTITDNSASAIVAGPNGGTNPTLKVDASTASAATGVKVKSAAAAAGVAVSAISSGTDENLTLDAKGAGTLTLNGTATGAVVVGHDLTLDATLTATPGGSTAAAGSTTSDAGVLPAGTSNVYPTTAADGTKGVRVHASDKVTGRMLFIGNGVSNQILKVYAPSGGTINGGSADAAFSGASGKGVIIVCLSGSGNTWLAF